MTRRSFVALLLSLVSWASTRLRGHQNAQNRQDKSEETGETGLFEVVCLDRAGLVFWRGTKSGWQGHVGFYAGEDATHYHVLGGNQSDSISITRIRKTRLRDGGIRWPSVFPLPTGGRVVSDGSRLVETTNEA